MERVLEPEVMDDAYQSVAYAEADFSESNQWFADRLRQEFPGIKGNVLDLGCGPGDVDIRICRTFPGIRLTAVDASGPMIELAAKAVRAAGMEERIEAVRGYIPGLSLEEHGFDAVLSKDMFHHLPDPDVLWQEARRLGKPGALVCVMDLFRPDTPEMAREIVETVTPDEDPVLKKDFYDSLRAAFTPEEVREQLRKAGLSFKVERTSERHMFISGHLPL